MPPIVLAEKGVMGGVLRMVKWGFKFTFFHLAGLCRAQTNYKPFVAPILHIIDLWALQSPGYKLYPLYLPLVQHSAPVYGGQVATLHGAGLSGILSLTL